jgi:hypothetical protein
MRKRKMIGAALALLLGMSALTAGAAPPFEADTPDEGFVSYPTAHGGTVFETDMSKVSVMPAEQSELSSTELAALAPRFNCDLNVQNPHGSHHVSGTINVVAVVTCDVPAAKLRLALNLIRVSPNNKQWAAVPTATNENKARIQNNRAVSCSEGPGRFQGWGHATLTPPPGYVLSGSPDYKKYGNTVSVACGVARFGALADDDSPAESITFTFVREDLAG